MKNELPLTPFHNKGVILGIAAGVSAVVVTSVVLWKIWSRDGDEIDSSSAKGKKLLLQADKVSSNTTFYLNNTKWIVGHQDSAFAEIVVEFIPLGENLMDWTEMLSSKYSGGEETRNILCQSEEGVDLFIQNLENAIQQKNRNRNKLFKSSIDKDPPKITTNSTTSNTNSNSNIPTLSLSLSHDHSRTTESGSNDNDNDNNSNRNRKSNNSSNTNNSNSNSKSYEYGEVGWFRSIVKKEKEVVVEYYQPGDSKNKPEVTLYRALLTFYGLYSFSYATKNLATLSDERKRQAWIDTLIELPVYNVH